MAYDVLLQQPTRALSKSQILALIGSSSAPTDATYVVLSGNATLTAERILTVRDGLSLIDAGANSTVTIRNSLVRPLMLMGA